MISQSEIISNFHYDAETGLFFRKVNSRRRPNSLIETGTITFWGYCAIGYRNKHYTAHRLAWLYIHGEWPDCDIDHINGNRSDNRICNLRAVSRTINNQNRRSITTNKKSNLPLGVSYRGKNRKLKKPYYSSIISNGKKIELGYFITPEEAHEAYLKAKRNYHEGCTI